MLFGGDAMKQPRDTSKISALLRSLNDYLEAKKELSELIEGLDQYDDGFGREHYWDAVSDSAADFEDQLNKFIDARQKGA